jgi:Fe-S-cluster containining protein
MDLHKFRQRKIIRYGTQHALVLKDQCPWVDNENHLCGKYEQRPRLCKAFPESYRPFWNLKCKLMRERYKRGLIPKDVAAFKKVYDKKKSPFKFYKEK